MRLLLLSIPIFRHNDLIHSREYALIKLVEERIVRQFAALCPTERASVVITMIAPGLCRTGLAHNARIFTRDYARRDGAMMAQTAEEGRRAIPHGLMVWPWQSLVGRRAPRIVGAHVAHRRSKLKVAEGYFHARSL